MKKRMMNVLLAGVLAAGSISPAMAAMAEEADGKVLDIALSSDISTMDVMGTSKDYMVPMNVFDRLFDIKVNDDGSTEIVNGLATDYTVSDDGLTYTFTLREGVKFSNGQDFTAEDVEYTFMHLLSPESINADIPLEVEGAQDYMDGKADTVSGIKVDGDYQISMTLAKPNAGFVSELTSAVVGIIDKTTVEGASNFGIDVDETVGTGPYIVTEWVNNDHITLVKNENYWGEEPSVDTCVIHIIPDASTQNLMYQNGELDIIDLDFQDASIVSSTYETQYADNIVSGKRLALTYMNMNAKSDYLSDPVVRQAIQMAVDRQAILDSVYGGKGHLENSIIPEGVLGHNDNATEIVYDPDGAKKLLEDAGYKDGEITFEMGYDSSASANNQMVCQIIQQQLAAVGINMEIKTYDQSSWLATRKAGEMDSFVGTWTMDYNDPANIMVTFFGSVENTVMRSDNYQDTSVIDRVAAAPSIIDDDARYAEYQALEEKIIHEDYSWVPLFALDHEFAISDDVESYTPHWAGYGDFFISGVVMK